MPVWESAPLQSRFCAEKPVRFGAQAQECIEVRQRQPAVLAALEEVFPFVVEVIEERPGYGLEDGCLA